jgi:hypothetical protein
LDPILIVILDSDVELGFEIRKNEGCLDHGLLSLHSENLHIVGFGSIVGL